MAKAVRKDRVIIEKKFKCYYVVIIEYTENAKKY